MRNIKLKSRHVVNGYSPLHRVNARICSQFSDVLVLIVLIHLCPDIGVLYDRNNV